MVQTMEDQTSDHVRYRVVVRGLLGEHLAGVLDQLEIDPRPGQTSLTGNFADQAQLHGLLDQLRDLGIHLISVNPRRSSPGATQLNADPAHAFEESGRELKPDSEGRSK
jgi:hypothetical protein